MSRLFWKFLGIFWLGMTLFTLVSFYSASSYVEMIRAQDEQRSLREKRSDYLQQAKVLAANDSLAGLKQWLEEIDRKEAVPFLLLDEKYQDLLGREPSSGLLRLFEERRDDPQKNERVQKIREKYQVNLANGKSYYLLADFKALTLERLISRPAVMAIPLLFALLVSLFLSFLLAGYLSRPIKRLSMATRQLAQGNLTHRVRADLGGRQDELSDLAADFDDMADRLQQLLDAQRQLLSDVSHELRSPLARIQIALDLARQKNAGSEEIDRIETESQRLNELIAQLLSLNHVGVEAISERFTDVCLQDLLQDIVDEVVYEAEPAGKQISLHIAAGAFLPADESLLGSALENVLRNALRHTPENTAVAGNIRIVIRDHGPGLAEDMLEKVFQAFVRADEARNRTHGGYGLGLAIARRAVQAHAGDIKADNHADGGLQVSIELPVESITAAPVGMSG